MDSIMPEHFQPKILIVDDLPNNLLALGDILEDLDVEVIRATSGNEALSLIVREFPSCNDTRAPAESIVLTTISNAVPAVGV